MKKFLALTLAMLMTLSLVACGGSKTEPPADNSGSQTELPADNGGMTEAEINISVIL